MITNVTADHMARMEAATDEQLRASIRSNGQIASSLTAPAEVALRAQNYIDAAKSILAKRHPAPAAASSKSAPATERQVQFAMTLISERAQRGLPEHLSRSIEELRAMTKGQISTLISTLKEQY